jgi:tRNA A-37 threonylcarbamoyl transferase component Bud32
VDPTSELLLDHISDSVARYYPEMSAARVTCTRVDVRPRATLYYFDVMDAASRQALIVKVATSAQSYPVDERRPQVTPVPSPAVRHHREYASMTTLESSISVAQPVGIGAVRVLEHLPDQLAIVMEQVPGRDLGAVLGEPSDVESPARIADLIATSGRWLHQFHHMTIDHAFDHLHSSVDDFLASVREQTNFLGRELNRASYFDSIVGAVEDGVAAASSLRLPMGLRHGDYKPENIMIRSDGSVVGIDSVPAFRSVVYEDLAKFTVRLGLFASPLMRQHTMARSLRPYAAAYRDGFLSGYFGAERPHHPEVELYEVLQLLQAWSKRLVQQQLPRSGRSRLRRSTALVLAARYFEPTLSKALLRIAAAQKPSK